MDPFSRWNPLNRWPFNRHYIYWFFFRINKEVRQFKHEYNLMERELTSLMRINPQLQDKIVRLEAEIKEKQRMIDALSDDLDAISIKEPDAE